MFKKFPDFGLKGAIMKKLEAYLNYNIKFDQQ